MGVSAKETRENDKKEDCEMVFADSLCCGRHPSPSRAMRLIGCEKDDFLE
jgi:hypothetical protein